MNIMAKSIIQFCEGCSSLMSYREKEDSGLELYCRSCGRTTDTSISGRILNIKHKSTTRIKPSDELHYDTTQRMTKHIDCTNPLCDSNKVELWGTIREDGLVIQPDIMLTNYFTSDRRMTYIC